MDRKVSFGEQFDFVKGMSEDSATSFTLSNFGVVFGKLSKEAKDTLLEEAIRIRKEDSEKNDYRSQLAGSLSHEYNFIHMKDVIKQIVFNLVAVYERQFNFMRSIAVNQNNSQLDLTQLWVNFMSKGNFNPPHKHSGVFSFVIWLKIPYEIQNELNYFPKTNYVSASCFTFLSQNILGQIDSTVIPIDKNYEGIVCLFPSTLNHSVNPFYTSDEERISIAGNLYFQNKV